MSNLRGWTRHSTEVVCGSERTTLHRDRVTNPGGELVDYEWFSTADQVRVAALVDDRVLFVSQEHYLIGDSLQLPGGAVESPEDPETAAKRELREETGYHGGQWLSRGALHPLPGLTDARIHLWTASDLDFGQMRLDRGERDLTVVPLALPDAVAAVRLGRVTCAASIALVLQLASSA